MTNPLSDWLRAATAEERLAFATACGTSVSYLYQLSGARANRRRPNVVLSVAIEANSRAMRAKNRKLPLVTVLHLAALFE